MIAINSCDVTLVYSVHAERPEMFSAAAVGLLEAAAATCDGRCYAIVAFVRPSCQVIRPGKAR